MDELSQKIEQVESYGKKVLSGEIVTGRLTRLAVERQYRDLKDLEGYTFDPAAGLKYVEFFKLLRHYKMVQFAGSRFTLAPWQAWLIYVFFGWKQPNGKQRFDTAYVEMGKKQGKTTLVGGLGLAHLIVSGEAAPEVYTIARAQHQARICLDEAREIAQRSPDIKRHLDVREHEIRNPHNAGKMRALSGDHRATDGKNASFIIADEVHSYDSFDLLHTLTSGAIGRQAPVTFLITTAGSNKGGPGYSYREHAVQVLEQEVQREDLFSLIYTIDPLDDWKDPDVWIKSLPSLGVIVTKDAVEKKIHAASVNPSEMNDTLNKTLNIWTQSESTWISEDIWDRCNKGLVDLEALEGKSCYAGLDLAYKSDFSSFSILFELDNEELVLKQWTWCTENEARRYEDVYPYWGWQKDGFIDIHSGDLMDGKVIGITIKELIDQFGISRIAYDPAAFNAVYQAAVEEGADGELFFKFIQGDVSYTPAIQDFEYSITSEKLNHCGNPLLAWQVQNATLKQSEKGLIKFWKEQRQNKIDGVVSAAMAYGAKKSYLIDNPPIPKYDGNLKSVPGTPFKRF